MITRHLTPTVRQKSVCAGHVKECKGTGLNAAKWVQSANMTAHHLLPMQILAMETEQIKCKKCNRDLGKLAFDGAVLVIGNAEFYANCRFSCKHCGAAKTFYPNIPNDITAFDGETKKILNGLAASQKYENLKEKRRKKGN